MKPEVSVVITCYNSEKYVKSAIESVLGQTYLDYEIIVIDDGSTDKTRAVIESTKWPIKYFYKKNGGISSARNCGLSMARGKYIAFLDADDIWLKDKLQLQVNYLREHSDVAMVFSLAQNTFDPSRPSDFPVINAHIPPNCLFRRELINGVGLFDESITLGEFADWYARAIETGIKIYSIPKLLVKRRIHGANMGIVHKHDQRNYLYILKKKLDRTKSSLATD